MPEINQKDLDAFQTWRDNQKYLAWQLMEQCVAWSDEAPEDERDMNYPVDMDRVGENFLKFLDLFQAEVAKATLGWVSNHLMENLEKGLQEAELEIEWEEVLKAFKEDQNARD